MAAKYILAVLSVIFLVLATIRIAQRGAVAHPQTRTWLIVALVFGVVSIWLFAR